MYPVRTKWTTLAHTIQRYFISISVTKHTIYATYTRDVQRKSPEFFGIKATTDTNWVMSN